MDRRGDMEMAKQLRMEFAGRGGREHGGGRGRGRDRGGGWGSSTRGGRSGGSSLNPAGEDLHAGSRGTFCRSLTPSLGLVRPLSHVSV